jgi:FMN phosphatase YigB (HAD superfamily)
MTAETTEVPRAAGAAGPCPQWCVIDHSRNRSHISAPMDRSDPATPKLPEDAWVKLVQGPREPRPSVTLMKVSAWFRFDVRDAGDFAELFEEIAECTPEQMRQIAAEVRAAAAAVKAAG